MFTPKAFPTEMTSAVASWNLGTKRGHEKQEVLFLSPGGSIPSTFPPKPQVLTDTLPEKILEGRETDAGSVVYQGTATADCINSNLPPSKDN